MLLIPRARAARPGLRVTVLRSRHTFRAWRGERPFWAGLFTFTAALPILYWPYASLDLGGIPLALSTTSGAGSLTIGVLLMTLGITLWYRAHLRVFAGITTLLLALISFPVANLGGLFLGVLLGLIGGSLACAWLPPPAAAGLADGAAANVTADVAEGVTADVTEGVTAEVSARDARPAASGPAGGDAGGL